MRFNDAVEKVETYRPEILIVGVTVPVDGEFGVSSVLVCDKKGYAEAIRGFELYRVFRLKEGELKEVNEKLLK